MSTEEARRNSDPPEIETDKIDVNTMNGDEPQATKKPMLDDKAEEEYKQYQAKIREEIEAAKMKVNLVYNNSNYTTSSHPVQKAAETEESEQRRESLNIDSLLRLFKSEFFDSWIGISYLFRYRSPGVHDYLCNQLYSMPDMDIEFYLIELCTMLVHGRFKSTALEKFILDKCKQSVHFALLVNWLFYSSMIGNTKVAQASEAYQAKCEIAAVNGTLDQNQISSLSEMDHCNESASDLREMQSKGLLEYHGSPEIRDTNTPEIQKRTEDISSPRLARSESVPVLSPQHTEATDKITQEALEKLDRCEYFYHILHFVEGLGQISDKLRTVPVPYRQKALVREMKRVNESFHAGIYLPLWEANAPHYCILRLAAEDVVVLKSRERVPFILLFEAIPSSQTCSSRYVHKVAREWNARTQAIKAGEEITLPEETFDASQSAEENEQDIDLEPAILDPDGDPAADFVHLSVEAVKPLPAADSELKYDHSPFGEPFAKKQERIRAASPYGHLPGWHIRSVIIKYGDDCKQEYLALQLIQQFKNIWTTANLPLYVRPYRILVNSPDSGIIETITDAISVDGLKKFYSTERQVTLKEHFLKFYVDPDSREFKLAVRNFVESLAGYSLVTYLLQIKDRHNGNILIDAEGHLIHIDFGFMLTNSPGNINAENVAFKFTQEYMELMGGPQGSMFSYFKGLMRCGYLEVRKQYEKIISLVEIMSIDTTMPCFSGGQNAVESLRDRFNLTMTEQQVETFLDNLIEQSFDSWRTRYYDRFQYMTNNILF